MSNWFEERRADKAAEAEQERKSREFEAELRRKERRADREEERQLAAQKRREKAQRKQARAARREKVLQPSNVYRKGTLALVALSALASLPAQILHFVAIHWMLFPIGPAVEGAAWVVAAGVAYADERKLPAWVRWLLRGISLSAAGFAAHINYTYGLSLVEHGVSAENAKVAGLGLAAVTLGGPLFFEVRQWVLTLTASTVSPKQQAEERKRARHEKKRRKDHPEVVRLAERLISAAPYGTLKEEDAFAQAWEILKGSSRPGWTPKLHATAVRSAAALTAAQRPVWMSPEQIQQRIAEGGEAPIYVLPTGPYSPLRKVKKSQVVTDLPPASKRGEKSSRKGSRKGWRKPPRWRRSKGDSVPFHPLAKAVAADTARKHMAVNGSH
jgi:hypothetical protein